MVNVTALSGLTNANFCFFISYASAGFLFLNIPRVNQIYNNAFQSNSQNGNSIVSIKNIAELDVKVNFDLLETLRLRIHANQFC